MNQKTQKVLQILGIATTVILLAAILAISLIFAILPSPAEIGERLGYDKMATASRQTTESAAQQPTLGQTEQPPTEPNESAKDRQTVISEYLMDSERPLLDLCSTLKNAPTAKTGPFPPEEFGQILADSITSENRNPFIESFLPMLRYVLRLGEIQTLVLQTKEAVGKGDQSFLKKAEFYSQLVRAQQQVRASMSGIENVIDQSYLFYMMAKAVHSRPELADDPMVLTYCDDMEQTFRQNPSREFSKMRESFNEFLSENGIQPKEIGYDPHYKTEIYADLGSDQIKFSGGWIDSIIASPKSKQEHRQQDTGQPF